MVSEINPIDFYTDELPKLGLRSIWQLPTYALREMRDYLAEKYPNDLTNPYIKSYEEEIAYRQRQEQILRGE